MNETFWSFQDVELAPLLFAMLAWADYGKFKSY